MYLEEIRLKFIQPCTTGGSKIKIRADLSSDISEIFPYLNSYIKSAMYNKKAQTVTFKIEQKIVTLFNREVAITKLLNETDAYETMDYVRKIINETYENKENIVPSDEMKKLPSPIEIYKNLPKLNCKRCGEMTCIAFASKLLSGEKSIQCCRPLYEDVNIDKLEKLEVSILLLGYEI
ncbi:MAG: Fe-S cluster protein [Paraclostridium bifermentans]|uniref:(Fe-S)-binding protein n=1 Tax=Paraclostridium bifermentans TaxID=1490 RepID=UPI00241F9F44|nr:(Fe-S)-binding protein [Paraclostridium bifermentans]MBS5953528.1 Fe-S cluster protein [Paraclostridium bifermentans]